jgi:ppGpp synthetase/RelA/SpoT-type nucleotidyltranferase
MKQDIPKEFLDKYVSKQKEFQSILEETTNLLKLRLGQLAAREGLRARLTDARVKRPAKLWKNANKAGLTIEESFIEVEDLIGIRIVCNNVSDIEPLVEMLRMESGHFNLLEIKHMCEQTGYCATHVRTRIVRWGEGEEIPCEIQIRTLAQDLWARLSRSDIYGKEVPSSIQTLAHALSAQLLGIDEIAQLIRDELNKVLPTADEIGDMDTISPQRLSLLYKQEFEEELFEWTLVDWIRLLEEAEVENIGEVRKLLDDTALRDKLDEISVEIRDFPLESSEWVVYSAMVAAEINPSAGIMAVRKKIRESWDEIVAFASHEALSEMPETIEEFVEMLERGYVPVEALRELGGIENCIRCGTEILRPEIAAEAVLDYYGNPDIEVDLKALFIDTDIPELESFDFSGACSYCSYQMSKDD